MIQKSITSKTVKRDLKEKYSLSIADSDYDRARLIVDEYERNAKEPS